LQEKGLSGKKNVPCGTTFSQGASHSLIAEENINPVRLFEDEKNCPDLKKRKIAQEQGVNAGNFAPQSFYMRI